MGDSSIDVGTLTRKRELLAANDLQFGIHRRRGEAIVGKQVEIGAGKACDNFISCSFEDCEIRLLGPGRLVCGATSRNVFKDCFIRASKKQIMATWEAGFERCYFRGHYEARFAGVVVDCDFSTTTLNSASFLQSESLGGVVWPNWPHVIIDSPESNYEDWKSAPKPSDFNRYIVQGSGVAVVFNIVNAVKDPDTFWESIRHKSYVHSKRDA